MHDSDDTHSYGTHTSLIDLQASRLEILNQLNGTDDGAPPPPPALDII